jgi:hypothetical protein
MMELEGVPENDCSRAEYYFSKVHGGRMFHPGVRETLRRLHEYFPGHGISEKVVRQLVADCPRCQKDRLVVAGDIQPVTRHLIPEDHRTRLGIDALTITPEDHQGNKCAIVVVEQKTKHTAIYPARNYTQETAAQCLFRYMCTFGLHDEIISDPGVMFLGDTVAQLNTWLGIRHKISLVDVHESNGVERTNQEILRHLRSLCNDERIRKEWSEPHVIGLIEYALNSRRNSETSHTAFELKFGTDDAKYFRLPDEVSAETISNAWLKSLNEKLKAVREVNMEFQKKLIMEKTKTNPQADKQNKYQPGDFILYDVLYDPCRRRSAKLDSRYRGPYEVIHQDKDEVQCQTPMHGNIAKLLVERVKLFVGSRDEAYRLALEDADQFVIDKILSWKGDPEVRTTMEFEVLFQDGDCVWKPYDKDLADAQQFENFCVANPELYLLRFTVEKARLAAKQINDQPITEVQPGDEVFVDLRYFGCRVYDEVLNLEDKYHTRYMVRIQYTRWAGRTHKKIDAFIPVFQTPYMFNHLFILTWGCHRALLDGMVEVSALFLDSHRDILQLIPEKFRVQAERML